MSIRAGFVGVALWLAFLAWAFAVYPHLDNLAVAFPVWAAWGLPGIEFLREQPLLFALVAIAEMGIVFAISCGVGTVMGKLLRSG